VAIVQEVTADMNNAPAPPPPSDPPETPVVPRTRTGGLWIASVLFSEYVPSTDSHHQWKPPPAAMSMNRRHDSASSCVR
jgi:hypothetical protein